MTSADPRRYVVIYTALKARIGNGTYPPGTPLPLTRTLMDEFQVSRDTVQRSLRMLADENLIVRWPGLGYYVAGEPRG